MLKIQSILAIKVRLIPSLSACKHHSINLLNSSNPLANTPDDEITPDGKYTRLMMKKVLHIFDHAHPI